MSPAVACPWPAGTTAFSATGRCRSYLRSLIPAPGPLFLRCLRGITPGARQPTASSARGWWGRAVSPDSPKGGVFHLRRRRIFSCRRRAASPAALAIGQRPAFPPPGFLDAEGGASPTNVLRPFGAKNNPQLSTIYATGIRMIDESRSSGHAHEANASFHIWGPGA